MKSTKSKNEIVYEYLLEQFISRKIQSGDKLNISKIAVECSVSEIPVREALRQLEGDGYVKFTSNKGAFATSLDRNAISQLVQVKGVLEGFATRLAVDNLTKEDIKTLNSINKEMETAMIENDSHQYSILNMQFHKHICLRCGNEELIKILEVLWKRWAITKEVFFGEKIRMKESLSEHAEIIKLIEDHKYVEIEEMTRKHKFFSVAYWMLCPSN